VCEKSFTETIRKRTLMYYYLTPVIFSGLLTLITGGELEFKLMSMMQYDASTIEITTLTMASKVYMRKCLMQSLNSYRPIMTLKNTIMEGQVKPYKIFNKSSIRVGVFGIGIELDGLVKKNVQETVYNNPVEASQEMVRY
jgi:5'-nucleotidase